MITLTQSIVGSSNNPIGVDDELVVVLKFDMDGPARQHIESIMFRGNLSQNMIILSDGRLITNANTYIPEMKGTGWLLSRGKHIKDQFMIQWQFLCDKYDWDPLVDWIPVVNSNHINGYLVPHNTGSDPVFHRVRPRDCLDQWEWITQNCNGKAWWHEGFWLFDTDADAVMFKLAQKSITR